MAQHGGYRRPTNPAPISGPGAHSRRTDGQPIAQLSDPTYGEQTAFAEAQQAAPVPSTSGLPTPPQVRPGPPPVVGLGEPSAEPDTPVTAGAEYGPGPGPGALGPTLSSGSSDAQDLAKYLPFLIDIAQKDSTPRSVKRMVRMLIANS